MRADPRVAFHRLPDSCCLPPPNELRKHCPPQQSTSCRLDFVLRALCLTGSSFFPVLRINWVWLADWTLPCQYVHACVATSLCKHGGIQPKLPNGAHLEVPPQCPVQTVLGFPWFLFCFSERFILRGYVRLRYRPHSIFSLQSRFLSFG